MNPNGVGIADYMAGLGFGDIDPNLMAMFESVWLREAVIVARRQQRRIMGALGVPVTAGQHLRLRQEHEHIVSALA